ncbi:MAG TPA: hypothetical protein VEW68_00545 [Patescibacteria group bacterium]|nr:hypothetical protein [Patescibacteria group bacterium]
MKSNRLAFGLVVLGLVCVLVAALYAAGILQFFTSVSSGPHTKHAILFAVLALACFIGANFAREKVY